MSDFTTGPVRPLTETQKAEDDLYAYFMDAEGEAAGVRAVWLDLSEEKEGGGAFINARCGGRPPVDPYPDHLRFARALNRRVHRALERMSKDDRLVLAARYSTHERAFVSRGGPELLGALGFIATTLDVVQEKARAERKTYIEAIRDICEDRTAAQGLLDLAKAMLDGALMRYVRATDWGMVKYGKQ